MIRILPVLLFLTTIACAPHRPPADLYPQTPLAQWRTGAKLLAESRTLPEPERSVHLAKGLLLLARGHETLSPSEFRDREFRRLLGMVSLRLPETLSSASSSSDRRPPAPWMRLSLLAARREWGQLTADRRGRTLLALIRGKGTLSELRLWLPRLASVPFANPAYSKLALNALSRGVRLGASGARYGHLLKNVLETLGEYPSSLLFKSMVRDLSAQALKQLVLRFAPKAPSLFRHYQQAHLPGARALTGVIGLPLLLPKTGLGKVEPKELGTLLFKGGSAILALTPTTPLQRAEQLRLAGQTARAVAILRKFTPAPSAQGRLDAGFTALRYMDSAAALTHLRWAFSLSTERLLKARILSLMDSISPPGTVPRLEEIFRLAPTQTTNHLLRTLRLDQLADVLKERKHVAGPALGKMVSALRVKHPRFRCLWPAKTPGLSEPLPSAWRPIPARKPAPSRESVPLVREWPQRLLFLVRHPGPPVQWKKLFVQMAASPWLPLLTSFYARYVDPSDTGKLLVAEGRILAGEVEASALVLEGLEHSRLPVRTALRMGRDLYLRYGLRHRAAGLMKKILLIGTLFTHPSERARSDLRLSLAAEHLLFLERAGFSERYGRALRRLVADASRGGNYRAAAVAGALLNFGLGLPVEHVALLTLEQRLRNAILRNDRTLLSTLVGALSYLFPLHPQLVYLRCHIGDSEACRALITRTPPMHGLLPYPPLIATQTSSSRCNETDIMIHALERSCGMSPEEVAALRNAVARARRVLDQPARSARD